MDSKVALKCLRIKAQENSCLNILKAFRHRGVQDKGLFLGVGAARGIVIYANP